MSKTLDVLKKVYKPLRVTLKKNTTILETTEGKFLVKEKKGNDLAKTFAYLKSRNFDNFPKLIDDNRDELNVFEYIDDVNMPKEQKGIDMVDIISSLHTKSTYFKPVSEDQHKKIYENINNNILYLKEYYDNIFKMIEEEIYMSPSHYLLIRNSSKISASLDFAKSQLDEWYELVKFKNKERVALIHNNLSIDHYIRNDKGYLISWEKSKIDTPVLDLVTFYKNDYFNLDFESILERYLKKNPLSEEEKKLFFILISIIDEVKLDKDEFYSCQSVRKSLDYLFISEQLVRPYYTVEKKE